MAGGIVGWHFFDAESGLVPEDSNPSILPGGGKGRIVVLAATPFALTNGWAARAAIAIAKDWSEADLRIFLMDLGLDNPTLHQALDLPNGEGVSDAFLFGASVQHVARPVLDDAFFFAPAGSAPGDPEEVLGHPRWNDLAGGFSEADATLLLFLPTGIPGAGKILSRATDIIFLSAQGESADSHLGPASIKVVSMMGPFGSPPEEVPEVSEAPEAPEAPEEVEEVKVPEEPAMEDFSAGLELADGFGAAVPEEEEGGKEEEGEPSSFDFSGGMELAGGFGGEEPSDETEAPEEEDEDADFSADSGDTPDFGGDFGLVEEEPSPGFGEDLVMGAALSGGLEKEDEGGALDEPDFGADFVDMGPVDEPGVDEAAFGGDLVQGADFGAATGGDIVAEPPEETPFQDQPPADQPTETPASERPTPRKR